MADIEADKVDCIVVYKVDRLSRSLLDFSRMMETFDRHNVSFVSVTQQFNTTHSMGRLTLNILLSFAQFEREIISERTRDKMADNAELGRIAGRGETDRLADLQDRISKAERRASEIDSELAVLDDQAVSEEEVARALAEFDTVWEALTPARWRSPCSRHLTRQLLA